MDSPAHLAGKRSREAAMARDKEAWLAVFADDAIVEDPIGPSHFDPEGKGHRGKEAIAKFYDMAIAPSELTFNFEKTYQCGNEEANVGNIVIRAGGLRGRPPKACSPTGSTTRARWSRCAPTGSSTPPPRAPARSRAFPAR